jgi:catechol 2,3-dioxygenase-like lactoylglutathione lyase family enzyme
MGLRIANITVNTARPAELAQWWLTALGGTIAQDWGSYIMVGLEDGSYLSFQYVEGTEPGRVHIDFATADAPKEIARLIEAGATHIAEHEAPGGAFSWTVLADPDGNQFCVSQSP